MIRFLEPIYQAAELGLSVQFLWQLGVSGYALLCRFEGRLRSSAQVGRDSFCFFPFSWCLFYYGGCHLLRWGAAGVRGWWGDVLKLCVAAAFSAGSCKDRRFRSPGPPELGHLKLPDACRPLIVACRAQGSWKAWADASKQRFCHHSMRFTLRKTLPPNPQELQIVGCMNGEPEKDQEKKNVWSKLMQNQDQRSYGSARPTWWTTSSSLSEISFFFSFLFLFFPSLQHPSQYRARELREHFSGPKKKTRRTQIAWCNSSATTTGNIYWPTHRLTGWPTACSRYVAQKNQPPNFAGRVLDSILLLQDLLQVPDPDTLEKFLALIPMVFSVAIVSPHGYFGQAGILGLPDTGG